MSTIEAKTDFDEKMTEEELKSAKSLIQTFLQSLKAFQLYEASHPILLRFLDRIKEDFDHYFEKHDSFSIQVDQVQLLFQRKVVYESRDLWESLAFLFFKDGIREIRFFKGLEFKEIMDFLNIIRKSSIVNRMEDDLVTLFWDKDFLHIDLTVVDEFFEGDGILIPLTEEDLLKGLEYRGFGRGWAEGDDKKAGAGIGAEVRAGAGAGAEAGTGIGAEPGIGFGTETGTEPGFGFGAETALGGPYSLVAEGLRQALNLSSDQSLAQVCAPTPDEIEEIYRRAHQEEQLENLYILVNNFTEILLHLGENTETYENMISYFERIIKSFLEQEEVNKAAKILKNLHDTMLSTPLKEKQSNTIVRVLQISSDSRSIELLGRVIKQNREADRESILQYLQLLTEHAVDPLCCLLRELESDRWRRVVRERLVELCQKEIKPLVKFLSDSNASFVSDLLYILGKVEHPSTAKYLTNLDTLKDHKVREEVLKLATTFEEKGKDIVQKFLTDPVPEMRGKAALILAKIAKDQAVKSLLQIILSEDFYTRSYEEKVSFFKALAETRSNKAIPVLEQIFKKRKLFKKAKWEEMRLCAANALRMMGAGKE